MTTILHEGPGLDIADNTDGRILFKDEIGSGEHNKPVAMNADGVYVYQNELTHFRFDEMDKVVIASETRLWRVITTTGMLLCATLLAILGIGNFEPLMDGRIRGLGAVFIVFGGIGCALMGPFLVIRYFMKLGTYFSVHINGNRHTYFFESCEWNERKELVTETIRNAGCQLEMK